ncbi:Uncharacterised protein [Candidatus Venteria ishoeyi]|uniref:Uncharacterized protein n=2 Tax=Candidatus Venteria ishoeyi TaxID=1899563 RepID=A0A1H6F8B5_9GAMM|nr:Uncharacterised protein [Candidatus Venteria ishoeyi]
MHFSTSSVVLSLCTLMLYSLTGFAKEKNQPVPLCDDALSCEKKQSCAQTPITKLDYQQRGSFCEGVYLRNLAASEFEVVGLAYYPLRYQAENKENLDIFWQQPQPSSAKTLLKIRATALDNKRYRMDTHLPLAKQMFSLPVKVLQALHQKKVQHISDIGIATWFLRSSPRGLKEKVYLPVHAHQGKTQQAENLTLKIRFNSELTDLYYRITQENERRWKVVQSYQPLQLGYYPAKNAFSIPLQGLNEAGLYRIDIRVKQESRRPAAHRVLVLIP